MKILSMPKGGPSRTVLYENGTFNVSIESPGSYSLTGYTMVAATQSADRFTVGPSGSGTAIALLGTAAAFDFTNYSNLYVRCKGITIHGGLYGTIDLVSDKTNFANNRLIQQSITNGTEAVITIDVSSLTTAYLCFDSDYTKQFEVYEIWAE